ncbi:TPA: proteasome ATPase [Candidatus Poribacteria bacterium]|nr:proteasome ATPase [Candidatus Poribacteria bacterium]HEX30121.1 proteasome ATPase [Candidatus Poribacteria bacterium]
MESLENEVANLRRKLNSAHSEEIELRLYETTRELINAHRRNRKLTDALRDVREQIETLKERVDKLTAPPNNYAVFLNANDDGTVDVDLGGRKWRVNVDPSIDVTKLRKGQEVIVNSEYNVVGVRQFDGQGEVVKVKERLDEKRVIVNYRADEERVVELAETVKEEEFRYGDTVLVNLQTGLVMEKLPKAEVKDLLLEEVPDITYDDIGGLDKQIEQIRDAIELPYVYPEEYKEFGLTPPKGILLYGPPGCGKTLIAKAVANSLAKKAREITGNQDIKGYFINIKGPELLNKYVGETERKIREIFQRAKEKAQEGMPVVIFFDEMDSLFRMRGLGISSDMESTIVPQFLAEIDGVEGVRNVIVIGASNRQDLLDPAILRPGRLDIKIKIDRPDEEGAKDIFSKYLKPDLPIAQSEIEAAGGDINAAIRSMIERAVEIMYAETDENKFLEVTYAHGEREILYFKDFVSGAMIANIVSRAKKHALKRYIQGEEEKGIRFEDIEKAIREEFKENEDLPNTANPDDWAKISGRKSERIVGVRTLFDKEEKKKDYRIVGTGQYL